MTTDKSQPTGWVVVDFEDEVATFRDRDSWQARDATVSPFPSFDDAYAYLELSRHQDSSEVHPWPLPASVLARLKERHPTVDWSQVPVADAPAVAEPSEVEKLRSALREIVSICGGGTTDRVSTEFLMGTPGEVRLCVANLRAEVERLTQERDEHQSDADVLRKDLAAYADQLCAIWALLPDDIATQGGPAASAVRGFIDRLTRERDELREELSRCKQAHSAAEDDVESLREQLSKTTLSRRDEFAKAALTGMLSDPSTTDLRCEDFARRSVLVADATIRALDGAGGA